ncbi:phosphoribosylformimino-5-aminoimidazole carboxamide ribotide isomerase [Sphingomonas kaistensis]|uniref:1-(5-phosphoribosyl)-5-[(5-phosphoribosylamino)methylideneamino] imidazole-4-carboxamide isomerase n=1 Tax=Sphingomonas kaistensis TaxID=298708 RepID=A0A7X5Y9Z2_9SPHN|nr:1-(5-phosphoribosyl)-5-[(5-phosphoribosylamino)methylideneamino] imidazole-4-carboxamide isomerase [Sphingomonas kaistensis]NJC06251.1 phosphoribosylformimino-5-aminoimidazole carboxamide ribotide isomerase [Sphingomonas kaistensis]
MILYPAMDLIAGRIVRLRQGRFDDVTFYEPAPHDALRNFAEAGAQWAHVVDLDGARAGAPAQHALLKKLAATTPLRLQVAGGVRTVDHVAALLEAGAARVVVGSLAVRDPQATTELLERFGPDRITLSLDVRVDGEPMVATHGWQQDSGQTLWDVAALYPAARHLLLTDIGRDGMLEGPNQALLAQAVERLPHLAIQASGGVTSLDDIARLTTDGAILGRAMWEGRLDLAEALRACS